MQKKGKVVLVATISSVVLAVGLFNLNTKPIGGRNLYSFELPDGMIQTAKDLYNSVTDVTENNEDETSTIGDSTEVNTSIVESTVSSYVSFSSESNESVATETTECTTEQVVTEEQLVELVSTGGVLTPSSGVNYFGNQKETYYNLDMSGVISIMRNMGYSEEDYPYWVRDDGVKMLGGYIIIAANLDIHPRGSIVETSLGTAIVCDTGGFATSNPYQVDIAVSW